MTICRECKNQIDPMDCESIELPNGEMCGVCVRALLNMPSQSPRGGSDGRKANGRNGSKSWGWTGANGFKS